MGNRAVSLSSREAWERFQSWLLDVHPRARNQSALLDRLMGTDELTLPIAQLHGQIWPLEEGADSDELFKREDRFRRLLSDLRRNLAEYNRLSPGDGRLMLTKQGRASSMLTLGMTEPTSSQSDSAEDPGLLCDCHDVLAGTETLIGVRWSLLEPPGVPPKSLTRWLIEDVPKSISFHSDGPEWRAECLVRRGAGHEVERLARTAIPAAEGLARYRMSAIWGEAFDTVAGLGRAHDFLHAEYMRAQADGVRDRDPQAYFRLARLVVRSISQDSAHSAEFHHHISAFVEEAYQAKRRCDAHALQAYHLHRVLSESFEHDRPSLRTQAMRELQRLLDEATTDPLPVQLYVRTIYWIGRAQLTRDLAQTLQESRTILREMVAHGYQLPAAMIQSYQVHLLCQAGEWERAAELSCPNICRRIHYVDRSGLVFPLRDFENTLRAGRKPPKPEVFKAIEFVRATLGGIVQDYASHMLCRNGLREPAKELPREQIEPLMEVLPWVLESDWHRLLVDVPPSRPF